MFIFFLQNTESILATTGESRINWRNGREEAVLLDKCGESGLWWGGGGGGVGRLGWKWRKRYIPKHTLVFLLGQGKARICIRFE